MTRRRADRPSRVCGSCLARHVLPRPSRLAGSSGQEQLWYLDTNKAVASIFIFYGYVFLVPLFFWVAFRIFKTRLSVVQTACIFG